MNTNKSTNTPSEVKESLATNDSTKEPQEESFFGSWQSALLLSALGFIRAAMKGFEDPFGLLFFFLGIAWLLLALASGNKK